MMEPDVRHGATVDLTRWQDVPLRALLFGEAQGRVVVSTHDPAAVLRIADEHGVPAAPIGMVEKTGAAFRVRHAAGELSVPVERLAEAYHGAIPRAMTRVAAAAAADAPLTAAGH